MKGNADWKAFTLAGALLAGFLFAMYKVTIGKPRPLPTAEAPMGNNPTYFTEEERARMYHEAARLESQETHHATSH